MTGANGKHGKVHEPSSDEILKARRMTREGKHADEVVAALGWSCSTHTATGRFRKFGLHLNTSRRKVHEGGPVTERYGRGK